MSEAIDLLLHPKWIIPIVPERSVLTGHAVAIRDGAIVAVAPIEVARQRFSPAQRVDLPGHVLIPGLVNLHVHAAMSLMRGIADDLPLMQWLQEAIWPAESRHVCHAFVRDGTLLAADEMLRGGITTCNEMYFHPEAAAEAFAMAGMRAMIGMVVIEFPTPYAANADDYLRKGLAARDTWKAQPLIHFALAPHAPYTVANDTLRRMADLAAELDCPIHMHVHETAHEIAESITQHGMRPLSRLAALGLLGPGMIAVHAVHLESGEMALLARHGCAVAHCPSSNLKLGSGIAPLSAMLSHGLTVGLGTDGAASNNRLDLFAEMRLAALLAKGSTLDPTTVPAHTALRMATLDGAKAIGLDHLIGSIEPGKRADLCAVALDSVDTSPCFDPVSHLVYVAGRESVTDVWVDGKRRVQNRKTMLRNSNTELIGIATLWQTRLQ